MVLKAFLNSRPYTPPKLYLELDTLPLAIVSLFRVYYMARIVPEGSAHSEVLSLDINK